MLSKAVVATTNFTAEASTLLPAFSLENFLKNLQGEAQLLIGLGVALVGIVAMGWAVIQFILKLLGSQGAQQKSWFLIGAAFFIGGAMAAGGTAWALMDSIAGGGKDTLEKLGSKKAAGFSIGFGEVALQLNQLGLSR